MMHQPTLQRRLAILLLVSVPLIWLVSTGVAAYVAHHEVDELYDTQLTLFARQLLIVNMGEHGDDLPLLPKTKKLIRGGDRGEAEDDDIGLAVWNADGNLLLSDGKGRRFTFDASRRGFYSVRADDGKDEWRLFYLPAPDGTRLVAVGQRQKLRHEVVVKVIEGQLLPWLLGLPVLLLLILWAVRKGLRPLQQVAGELGQRSVLDSTPLSENVPGEVLPMVQALNALFARIAEAMEHERRFTADAAHELRTPLAALQVQAEVMALMPDEAGRQHALQQLQLGIQRATRLLAQLLALSRLDPLQGLLSPQPVDWQQISRDALSDVTTAAAAKDTVLETHWQTSTKAVLPLNGDATLLTLLLRNLLDNAVRYCPAGSRIELLLLADEVVVQDNGPGIEAQWLSRVQERFFRPPGQEMPGSGLGLSIVERIASLHGLQMQLSNRDEGGLRVSLQRAA
ncbi:ATP-binding protein [Aquitalea sp. LB_tupeE]|uniref:ATP-binding protein n=1 Tax=Aquitalea sp. LB_tupeE TaxID=2748078 RepID=UPI0015C16176|nr:ATP-binding protein [Aquitalea sp. LB_tupeE]NWK78205.1 sensor histidine kinase N-terminal domain-containing protein [Aquitalea sp. LB_tupeE]